MSIVFVVAQEYNICEIPRTLPRCRTSLPVLCRPDIHRHDWKDCVNNLPSVSVFLFHMLTTLRSDHRKNQRRGHIRVREGVKTGSEKGQNWIREGVRTGSEVVRTGSGKVVRTGSAKASEQDQKGSEQD